MILYMTFNWNPTKNELKKMSTEVLKEIDIIYNSITDKIDSLDLFKRENIMFSNMYSYFSFMHDITDKIDIMIETSKILKKIEVKKKEIFTNYHIYKNIENIVKKIKNISDDDIKFIKFIFNQFKKNGVHMSSYNKIKLIEIDLNIYTYQNKFLNKLEEEPLFILNNNETVGLTQVFLDQYKKNDKYEILLNEHTYNYLIEYLEDREIRKKLQYIYYEKYKSNYKYIKEVILNRYKIAKLFNYNNFVDYTNKDNSLNTTEKILNFLYKLNKICTPKYEEDIINMCEYFNIPKINGKYILNSWDIPYLINNYKNKKNNISISIFDYFPIQKTLEKIMQIFAETFKLKIKKIITSVWHPSVIVYEISKNDKIIGEIYFDIIYRLHKITGSATSTIKEPLIKCTIDICEIQKSVTAVLANFPVHERNNCLTIQEISILFHEIMHALHVILGKCKYTFLCSNSVEFAFIETFPQLIELWLLNKDVLKNISSHYKTNEILPDHQINNIFNSNKMNRSINVKYQILLAILDILIYQEVIAQKIEKYPNNIKNILEDLFESRFNFIFNTNKIHININKENNPFIIFNHNIHGYSAQYYGYIWSETIANDLFKMIQTKKININNLINSISSANNYSPIELLKKYFNKTI
jgi:Zn-dependent oligopeptidase